jgi:hypothetical protein
VNIPLPLVAAIGLEAGEEVEWELLDRGELHLVRLEPSLPRGHERSARGRWNSDTHVKNIRRTHSNETSCPSSRLTNF